MSRRNFILFIIILSILTLGLLIYWYFTAPKEGGIVDRGGTNFLSDFNPFVQNKNTPPAPKPTTETTTIPNTEIEEEKEAKLEKVSSMPIAGYGVLQKERYKEIVEPPVEENQSASSQKSTKKPTPPATEFAPALRYVARADGNIYQTFVDQIEERKFSKTVIPKVYEAYFGNKGESVLMRYLKSNDKDIDTFVASLPKEMLGGDSATENEIKGIFLPENVRELALSRDSLKLFYLLEAGDGVTGTTSGILGEKKSQIFSSPFTEWLAFWPNPQTITLTTKPSSRALGYMFALNTTTKNFTKILGDINGLTTLMNPSGKKILYTDNTLALYLYDVSTKNSTPTGIRTMPEKCVWGKAGIVFYCSAPKAIEAGEYPDSWYRGEVGFSDQIWKINTETGTSEILVDPVAEIEGEETDGIKLSLDESEKYLFWVNKKDSFLWKFNLN